MAHITIEHYTKTKCEHKIYNKITTIGSSGDNDIVCAGPGIEATHAFVYIEGDGFWIEPASRKSLVYVNGDRIKKKTQIKNQDEIRIADLEGVFSFFDAPPEPVKAPHSEFEEDAMNVITKLEKLAASLSSDYTITSLLDHIMDEVIDLVNAERGFIILMNEGVPKIQVARNVNKETLLDAEGLISDSIIHKVIETKQPRIISDACNDQEFNLAESVIKLKLSSVMCAPLCSKGQLLGVIYVGNDNIINLFQPNHLDMLRIFASQTSLILANALLADDLAFKNRSLEKELEDLKFGSIIGNCYAMREIFRMIEKVATTDVSVLVEGETGTGKELIAQELHRRSRRAKGPFVAINCGAIPENLLESELFGHVKGAFTGAIANKNGRFQQANGGTLFLDEIGEMPTELQVKLLRVLQERRVSKVGANVSEPIDIRIVAATNKNLEAEVEAGNFREDLLYSLNVITLQPPPLHDREDDVILIAQTLLKRYADELNMPVKRLTPEAVLAMKRYSWPGNIRQLENKLKKGLILSEKNVIEPQDLDLNREVLNNVMTLAEAKDDFQRRYINEILERNQGNRTKTARDLGVDPRTIFRHLEKEKND